MVLREGLVCRFVFASFADKYKQPSKLSPAIAATNMHLQRFADSNDRVTYVDCNAVLLEEVSVLRAYIDHSMYTGLTLDVTSCNTQLQNSCVQERLIVRTCI